MERPDVPALVDRMRQHGCAADLADVTYYVGHATVTHREDHEGLARWMEAIYAAMARNSTHVADFMRLPQDRTIELGRQVAI